MFGGAGLAILLALGVWQVQRLSWKQGVLAQIESRITAPPAALPDHPDPLTDKYAPVRVTGTMGPAELHVLVSVKRVGAGYRIIAPFDTDTGRTILIDRGFVPDTAKDTPRATGAMEVTGNLHWPDEIDGFTIQPIR